MSDDEEVVGEEEVVIPSINVGDEVLFEADDAVDNDVVGDGESLTGLELMVHHYHS